MKNNTKNIVAALVISGLFVVPVLCSAQTGGGIVIDQNNIAVPSLNEDKSQAEVEAVEEMLHMEAKSAVKQRILGDPQHRSRGIFTLISNEINDDRSQAEAEAKEELSYNQVISVLQHSKISDQIYISSR